MPGEWSIIAFELLIYCWLQCGSWNIIIVAMAWHEGRQGAACVSACLTLTISLSYISILCRHQQMRLSNGRNGIIIFIIGGDGDAVQPTRPLMNVCDCYKLQCLGTVVCLPIAKSWWQCLWLAYWPWRETSIMWYCPSLAKPIILASPTGEVVFRYSIYRIHRF